MNRLFAYLLLSFLLACHDRTPTSHGPTSPAAAPPPRPAAYSQAELRAFLDSVGHLPPEPLAARVAFLADSVFRHQRRMSRHLSGQELTLLKQAARHGKIRLPLARRIFGDSAINETCDREDISLKYPVGYIPITYHAFSSRAGKECGFIVGDPGHCPNAFLYFLQSNEVIARHEANNRYELALNHYRDADGRTVVYYIREFADGSGTWWNNYFFYKYRGNELLPVLNELQNGNNTGIWGYRTLWLETSILKTKPLTVKMVYHSELNDSAQSAMIVEDSTWVQYTWNEKQQQLEGQFQRSKISRNQVLTYTLQDNGLLFINTHYRTLKNALLDSGKRPAILAYLRQTKTNCRRQY